MSKMRVYEAARKLNIDSSKLIKILNKKGIKVKSPIAAISQQDFENILKELSSSQGKLKSAASKVKPTDKKGKKRLSLVVQAGEEDDKEEPSAHVIPLGRSAKDTKEPEKVVAKKEKTPAKEEPAEAKAPRKPEKEKGILAYIALGLAAAALLVAIALNANIQNNAASLDKALEGAAAINNQVAAVESSVGLNQSMIIGNRSMISDISGQLGSMKFSQVRNDLVKRSDSLEELAATTSAQMSTRLQSIASGLRRLATTL